jgi:ribosomal protein S12 methylthiotransferase accessory factor
VADAIDQPLLPRVQVFHPFPECPSVVFARAGARSRAFAAAAAAAAAAVTDASGETQVLIGAAAGLNAEDVARRAANELIERTSNVLAGRAAERALRVVASYEELRRAGRPAVDPRAFPEAASPEASTTEDARALRLLWVAGESLVTGEERLVPACATFLRHRPPPGCSALFRAGSAGTAAHLSGRDAVEHALLEVLERDLIYRSWYALDAARPQLGARPSPEVGRILDQLGVQLTGLSLPGPARTTCIVACAHDGKRARQSFGARCVATGAGGSPSGAVDVAAFEALMVRWTMSTPEARRAWDAMRQAGGRHPRDALEHALWTFHVQDSLSAWLARAEGGRAIEVPARDLAAAVAAHTGEDVIAVDTTAPSVCPENVSVVRVVAPGARRLPGEESTAMEGQLPHPFG